jgi:hypothetical protein
MPEDLPTSEMSAQELQRRKQQGLVGGPTLWDEAGE